MKFLTSISCFLVVYGSVLGQQVGYISDFKLTEINKQILITWTIDSGQTCNGIDILRATDGIDFKEIGHISGVCGSITKSVTYTFLDESPVYNKENSYRLKLGTTGYSIIASHYLIGVPVGSAWVYPNPVTDYFKLKIDNPNGLTKIIEISDLQGSILYTSETKLSEVEFSNLKFPKGIYLIKVTDISSKENTVNRVIVN